MKRLFFVVAFFFMCFPILSQSPRSHFPFGMYGYWFTSMKDSANSYRTDIQNGENLYQFWQRNLWTNSYVLSFTCSAQYRYFMSHIYQGFNGEIIAMIPTVRNLSETHYLDFSTRTKGKNDIEFGNSPGLKIDDNEVGWKVEAKSAGTYEFVSNVNIQGAFDSVWSNSKNTFCLRNRELNSHEAKPFSYAQFYLRINLGSCEHTAGTSLIVNLSNSIHKGENDPNETPIADHIIRLDNTRAQEYVIPFELKYSDHRKSNAGEFIPSSAEFFMHLSIKWKTDNSPVSFSLSRITVYDTVGLQICEEIDKYMETHKEVLQEIENLPDTDNPRIILHLADEGYIGNFYPSRMITDYINTKKPNVQFFSTHPTFSGYRKLDKKMNIIRYISELSSPGKSNRPEYFMPDIYVFDGNASTTDYSTYIRNIYNKLYLPLSVIKEAIDEVSYCGKPESILQLHAWDNSLRNPTKEELIATSYIALVKGYKGIYFWWSCPENSPDKQTLYKPFTGSFSTDYLFDVNNMYEYKKEAINTVGKFLEYPVNRTNTIGDLLEKSVLTGSAVVGINDTNRLKAENFKELSLGERDGKIGIKSVEIIDDATKALSDKLNVLGVNSFYCPNDNSVYYLFVNLNQDGHSQKVKANFVTDNSKRKFKVTTLNTKEITGKTFQRDSVVELSIPENGAVVLKVNIVR
jgi:hypothetical protein